MLGERAVPCLFGTSVSSDRIESAICLGPVERAVREGSALELAVAHCAGRDRATAEVLQIAGEFLAWMTEGR